MSSKISQLTEKSLDVNDYTPVENGGDNYKLNVYDSINTHVSSYIGANSISSAGYSLNTGAYVYNTGNLSLSNSYNGKIIISNNTVSITYTIASGLSDGFSCQVVQNNTGIVTFTGAAGTSMNSYGGLTQIAGRYGSAGVQWTSANTYILAGNLS